jgi:glycosyltransferase involved in cell wall biosynthesis
MSSSDLRVSVVIPAFNAAEFLAEAIASVRAQDRPVAEIIVVDDGSTDGSAKLAESLGTHIRVLRHDRNRGLAIARNTGIASATGSVIAFIDADDLWPPKAMSLLLARLAEAPFPAIATGRIKVIGGPLPFGGAQVAPPDMEGFVLMFGCSVFRRNVFDEVGFLDPSVKHDVDGDWLMRARERGVSISAINAVTLIYRRHNANMTLSPSFTQSALLETLKLSIDRRRAAGRATSLPRWKTHVQGDQ